METLSTLSECLNCQVTLTGRQSKFCSNKCKNTHRRADLRDRLNKIKLESGCVKCGYANHPSALTFNHIDPSSKSFTIGQMLATTWEFVEEEVAKCEVLCANCHYIHTYENGHSSLRLT